MPSTIFFIFFVSLDIIHGKDVAEILIQIKIYYQLHVVAVYI